MNELLIEFLGGFTKTNQWSAILPEIMLGVLALALLGAEMALPKNKQTLIPRLAIWGQVIVLLVVIGYIGWCNVGESEYFQRSDYSERHDTDHACFLPSQFDRGLLPRADLPE